MSEFYHGVRAKRTSTSTATPRVAESGIPFIVGLAPVHTVGKKANEVILANSYADAVSAVGYSKDWSTYDICELMDVHFQKYQQKPIVIVNVLDPEKHKKTVEPAQMTLSERSVKLPFEAIKSTVVVKTTADGEPYKEGDDYELTYDTAKEVLVLEVIDGGKISASTTSLLIGYDAVDPTAVNAADIIGGFDPDTKTSRGLQLIDQVFPKYLVCPDLILAPNWSKNIEVASAMAAKAQGINTLFNAKALIDIDTSTIKHYTDVPTWKQANNMTAKDAILCWPMVTCGGKRGHMSVQYAGVMSCADTDNGGSPNETPSNKPMKIEGLILSDGSEVLLDITQANYLNSFGICTALNYIGGYVAWGNYIACYPVNTAPEDSFISVSRMFDWVSRTVIQTYWSKVDKGMTRRLIDSIVDTINLWLNGLVADEKLLGARIVFLSEENSQQDLAAGIMKFHIYMTPVGPAQEIDFVLEYDISYVASSLAV